MSQRLAPWPFSANSQAAPARKDARPAAVPKPDLRLLKGGAERRLERLSPRSRVLLLLVTVTAVLFGVVAFHVSLSQGQFELEALQQKADAEQSNYERLRLQVSELESPSRISEEAQGRMGMVTPEQVTPIAPTEADMPKGVATTPNLGASSTADDDNGWAAVKPYLSPSAP